MSDITDLSDCEMRIARLAATKSTQQLEAEFTELKRAENKDMNTSWFIAAVISSVLTVSMVTYWRLPDPWISRVLQTGSIFWIITFFFGFIVSFVRFALNSQDTPTSADVQAAIKLQLQWRAMEQLRKQQFSECVLSF